MFGPMIRNLSQEPFWEKRVPKAHWDMKDQCLIRGLKILAPEGVARIAM